MVKEVKSMAILGEVFPALITSYKKSSSDHFTKLEPIIEEGSEGLIEAKQKGSLFLLSLLFSAVFYLFLYKDVTSL